MSLRGGAGALALGVERGYPVPMEGALAAHRPNFSYLVIFLSLMVIAGCTPNVLIDASIKSEAATISGQQLLDLRAKIKIRVFILESVDNQPIDHGIWSGPQDAVVKVAPGEHKLSIRAQFNTGIGHPLREVIVSLTVPVEAGKSYRIDGEVKDENYLIWLEDASTGAMVGHEISAPYIRAEKQPDYLPILLPIVAPIHVR